MPAVPKKNAGQITNINVESIPIFPPETANNPRIKITLDKDNIIPTFFRLSLFNKKTIIAAKRSRKPSIKSDGNKDNVQSACTHGFANKL